MVRNIGPKESRKRLAFGIAAFVITVLLLLTMIAVDLSRWWRLFLFIPFMMATIGFLQYKEKT
ncbi:MAG TPA: hypothetical protein ENO22_14735 [candidate division Zixibacteria bacterium]|nr:hypothetical protein [candidate division Zixibacteria bacterium]